MATSSATKTDDLVTLTIDGHVVKVPKGTLVIEAARQVGVMVPHFCYHPKLSPDANCRMCLVEIEKMPRLQTSCSTPVAEGMVVKSSTSDQVQSARKSVLDFILANHPLDCPVCDQGGRCDLQDFSHEYTATRSQFNELKRVFQKEYFSPLIETQMNRCVQCLRCVRYCDQVMDVKALAPVGRGTLTEIKAFGAHELDCEFCGGCVQICPVGAITSRLSMYEFRPWMLKRTDSVCGYCGDGCQVTYQTKNNALIEVSSTQGSGRNNGDLCARGYFGYHVSEHPDRIATPLVKKGNTFEPATWEEALDVVSETLLTMKRQYGPDAIAGLISGRCTNEDIYVFQKFLRQVVGTNQVDSSARYGHLNGVRALQRVQGTQRWSVSFEDIQQADVLLLVGTNVTETNPITGLKVKEAVKRRGAQLITIEALQPAIGTISNIVNLAHHHLGVRPDQFSSTIIGLVKAAVEHHEVAPDLKASAAGYGHALLAQVSAVPWTKVEQVTGYASTDFSGAASTLCQGKKVIMLVGQEVLRASGGYGMTMNLLDLLLVTGKLMQPGCGLALLAEENNDQGLIEMGAVGDVLPGGASLSDPGARQSFEKAWGGGIPEAPGGTLADFIERMQSGAIKALFVVGENPLGSLPPASGIQKALEQLDFLVCQELFMTDTARQAQVVLPACASVEKDGTFVNTEGHLQTVRKAVEPVGEGRPDWEVYSALSVLMGHPMGYLEVKEIQKEIRNLLPGTRSLGPGPSPCKPNAAAVQQYVGGGYQRDLAERYRLSEKDPAGDGSLVLSRSQSLFHSGKLSLKAKGLMKVESTGRLYMNPQEAEGRGIHEGDRVTLKNERGQATVTVGLRERVPMGTAVFPEHFDGEVLQVFEWAVDNETQVPACRMTRVHVDNV